MSQKERNEWIERAKERVLRNAKETDTYVRDIMDLYLLPPGHRIPSC